MPGQPFGRTGRENLARAAKVPITVIAEAFKAIRTLKFSGDFGTQFRQLGPFIANDPVAWAKSWPKGLRAMFTNETIAKKIEFELRSDPDVQRLINNGATWLERDLPEAQRLARGAEEYTGTFLTKIPILKHYIRATERGFTVPINLVKFSFGKKILKRMEAGGHIATPEELRGIGLLLDLMAGRGRFPGDTGTFGKIMNTIFASARLQISRGELPFMLLHKEPRVRKEAARALVNTVALFGAVYAFLHFAVPTVRVEKNPLSSEFGKITYHRSRLDFGASYTPLIRWASQVLTDRTYNRNTEKYSRKNPSIPVKTITGGVDLSGEARSRVVSLLNFTRTKLNPAGTPIIDNVVGTNVMGEEVDQSVTGILKQLLVAWTPLPPLEIMEGLELNLKEAWDIANMDDTFDEAGRRLTQGVLSLFNLVGAGTTTYANPWDLAREAEVPFPLDRWEIREFRQIIKNEGNRPPNRLDEIRQERIAAYYEILENKEIVRSAEDMVWAYKDVNRKSFTLESEAYRNIFGGAEQDFEDPKDEPDPLHRKFLEYENLRDTFETPTGQFDFEGWDEEKGNFRVTRREQEFIQANTNLGSQDIPPELRMILKRASRSGRELIDEINASERARSIRGRRRGSAPFVKP